MGERSRRSKIGDVPDDNCERQGTSSREKRKGTQNVPSSLPKGIPKLLPRVANELEGPCGPWNGTPRSISPPAMGEPPTRSWLSRLAAPQLSWLTGSISLALITGLSAILYGPHVRRGGFYNDDWGHVAEAQALSFGEMYSLLAGEWGHRPLHLVYLSGTYNLFEDSTRAHLASSLVLLVLMAAALFWVLTLFRLHWAAALAVASILVVFPYSSGTRFWNSASAMSLSVALFLVGVGLAVLAFRRQGPSAWLLHALSVGAYVASILLFEVTVGAIALVILAYLFAAPWKSAVARWAVDLGMLAAVVLTVTTGSSTSYERSGLTDTFDNATGFAEQAVTVFARTLVPFGSPNEWPILGFSVLVVAGLGVLIYLRREDDPEAKIGRQWLALAGIGVVLVAVGYLPFVVGDPLNYQPVFPGGQNRTNVVAAVGYSLVVFAVLASVVTLIAWAGRRLPANYEPYRAAAATSAAVLLLLLVGLGNAEVVADQRDRWVSSWQEQVAIIEATQESVPTPEEGTAFVTFGHPQNESQGIPITGWPVHVSSSLRVSYADRSLFGYSVFDSTTAECRADGLYLDGDLIVDETIPYESLVMVDVASSRSVQPGSRAGCVQALEAMPLGPAYRTLTALPS